MILKFCLLLNRDSNHKVMSPSLQTLHHEIFAFPRLQQKGCGIAIIYKASLNTKLTVESQVCPTSTFECLKLILKLPNPSIQMCCICRPQLSKKNGLKTADFLVAKICWVLCIWSFIIDHVKY